jgi:WD40 repeat protein
LSPDGRLFAAAAQQYVEGDRAFYELQFYDSDTGKLLHSSDFETTRTAAISFSFDGSILAVSRSGRDGLQVDLVPKDGTQKLTHVVTAAGSTESRAVAFVGEQQRLALAGGRLPIVGFDDIGTPRFKDQGGVVIVVDQTSGKKLTSHEFKSFVTSLALTRDGSKMAVGMYDGTIAILTPL